MKFTNMAKAKIKKRTKRIRTGWKKREGIWVYIFKPKLGDQYGIKVIKFPGFREIPVGLNLVQTGGGFNLRQANKVGGNHLLSFLHDKYKKKIELIVFANGHGSKLFRVLKKKIVLSLSFDDFKELLKDLGFKARDGKNAAVQKRFSEFFPSEVAPENAISAGAAIKEIRLIDLTESDHESIADFIKKYITENSENDVVMGRIQTDLVLQGRKKGLDQVIKKFEEHLLNKEFSEKDWQSFLHNEVFFFLANYVESIRETNVNLLKVGSGEKKPDFVWIDLYGFLDVFEIKTPYTDILSKKIDDSHKNYYFSRASSQAISQIEKYIFFLENNVDAYQKAISKKTTVPFAVLKPKAFLIIGMSKEINSNPDKKTDFRLLRRLFKNIEFITFDELLDNLKNLAEKFEKKKS
jgi:hypothetical protein